MSFEFESVKLGKVAKQHKRKAAWRHVGKTLLYMLGGVLISLLYLYFSQGPLGSIHAQEVSNTAFIGAFLGFFLTNSPCARGKC